MDAGLIVGLVWSVTSAIVGWSLLVYVVRKERRNPKTEMTYASVVGYLFLSMLPIINALVSFMLVVEYSQHFAITTRTIYKPPVDSKGK